MDASTRHSPRERRALPTSYDAVLLASFGGPEKQEDVLPFLRNVTRGRGIPDERLLEVGEHYRALGGRSPINEQNRDLLAALRTEFDARGIDLPLYWGNRNWTLTMPEAVRQLDADGHHRVLAVATSAYSSYSSCRQYREDFGGALVEAGLLGRMRIDKVRPYFDHPGFLEPTVDGLVRAVSEVTSDAARAPRVHVLFSTHSIPTAMELASGPQEERSECFGASEQGEDRPRGWYLEQHEAACRYVMERVGATLPDCTLPWQLVFQSRSGPPQVPWLEPDVNDVISRLARSGTADAVVVVPIGFVSDHVEVIWDLDTEAADTARAEGLAFRRVATPGTDPRFVAALADLVEERLRADAPRRCATGFGGTPDVCGTACCHSGSARSRDAVTTSALDSEADARSVLGDQGLQQILQEAGADS
ncbi:ferrochelatase [Brachybacterium endophyticum]|uniref:ferrochelatase n=1 Tax=Brachybacterium endophyticum TaxID=2182385 RepID=UPI001F0B8516|nr:ferrochelatase [Brachybacterium endophyticum]